MRNGSFRRSGHCLHHYLLLLQLLVSFILEKGIGFREYTLALVNAAKVRLYPTVIIRNHSLISETSHRFIQAMRLLRIGLNKIACSANKTYKKKSASSACFRKIKLN